MGSDKKCAVRDGSCFSQWLDDTTIHGVKHVFKAPSITQNILWGIVFFVTTILVVFVIVITVIAYFFYPAATKITLDTDISEITFPAVTICNLNPIRLSYTEDNNLTSLLTYLYDPFVNQNDQCGSLVRETKMADKTLRQILFNGRYTLEDFVLYCYFTSSHQSLLDCKQNLSLTLTYLGYCYSFNSFPSALELTVSGSGARYGLSLLLNIQQEEYLPIVGGAGVRVTIQPRGVPPEPDERGILIPPGEEGLIELRTRVISDRSTRRTCESTGTNHELKFFSGYDYSLSTCRLERSYQLVADYCQCLDLVDDKQAVTNLLPDCTLSDICCSFASYFFVDESNCTEACDYTEYIVSTSYSDFPSDSSAESLAKRRNISAEQIKNDLVAVTIYFGDPHTRTIETEDSFTFTSLLSRIGGLLGLLLGASVISMIHLGLFTFDEVVDLVRKCMHQRTDV